MNESILSPALAWSGVLQRQLTGTPDFGDWLAQSALQPLSPERLEAWFLELSGEPPQTTTLDPVKCRSILRQLRRRVFFVAMVRDIAGQASLEEVTGAMSALADLAVDQAYRSVLSDLAGVHGVAREAATGRPQEMIVVGMGKLGGGELNVSSDIDLVMLYGDEGETDGPRPISHHEFYGKLTQRMMPMLSEADANGQVFRTDLRLRPDGDSGPLAWSLDAFEHYLFTQGREWERYAWLKGRALPARAFPDSDPEPNLRLLESMRLPFVYRKYFDFDALAALRALRERIRQDWQRKALARPGLESQRNIKLGEGGIREIEFVVQLTQLIKGGRLPALRQRGLLPALHAQASAGILPAVTAERLEAAYRFLRRTEHALQYYDDAQTHLLPQEPARREGLAQALGLTPPQFEETLAGHRTFVEETFRNAFRLAGIGETAEEAPQSRGSGSAAAQRTGRPRDATEEWNELTVQMALFEEQAGELSARVEAFLESHRIRALSTNSRNRVEAILPHALEAARLTAHPLTAAFRLMDLIEAIAQRSAYLALLAEFPETLVRIARLMAASPRVAEYLIQHPILLDSLISWQLLMEPLDFERIGRSLRADLDACLLPDGSPDIEQQMNLMRDLQKQLSFQLLAQDLEGVLTVEALADLLSALADMLLTETMHRTWPLVARREGDAPLAAPRMAVIAYGRLGGKEIGYSSDLDIIFVYDDDREDASEIYAKLGRRMSSWLSTMTSSGRLYEIDLRLRPDGDAGLLAQSIEGFEQYQLKHAWPWEHQALTRARFAAGDARVGALFEEVRRRVLTLVRDPDTLRADVLAMREKMSAGHRNKSADFDIKHDPGGMVDLEFVTQYLVLRHSGTHPVLIGNLGNIALLRLCGEAGLIDPEIARRAGDAYRNLRRRQHTVRLQGLDKARVPQSELVEERAAVRELWSVVLGEGNGRTDG
ncbi:MAG: bifunctional [glutamate--ammonia ligase]-adenylyl-L-tyrosine phosphorylase/[glutamate--ammonia-ligase] adenylyltransferase [Burkholderiaceae bacterium]|nr:bifunctional [glutamate--ammonia ligase]-adenylyl-L-tyrosine phosphorylase/[glutamate--ammonia-ligase] adenylyltransferase [Burkholderiaceae bacterium]